MIELAGAFGYNNPDPSPGSPNYGYDVWITVDETVQPEGEVRIIAFSGGLYAVTRVEVKNPGEDIPRTWQKLVAWMEQSNYRHGNHQWLEESPNPVTTADAPAFTLDLYLPIVG